MSLASVLKQVQIAAQGLGGVVDAVMPVATGDRTKWATIVAAAAPVIGSTVCSLYPPACVYVSLAGNIATTLAPLFAFAGLVRPSAPAATPTPAPAA